MTGTIHHIELYVSDLNKSRHFWKWLLEELGYSLFQEWAEGFSMKFSETYIVFVQTERRFLEIDYHRCRTGLNHLAFKVDTKEQINSIKAELIKRNTNLLYEDKYPYACGRGYYALFFEDPDRIKVELVLSK